MKEKNENEENYNIILSYYYEDGDSIMLTTEEDYTIFFQQVKVKTVAKLIVEINENKNIDIDSIECFGSTLNYQEHINNNNINSNINMNNIINNSNDKIINSYADINLDIDYNNQNINNNFKSNNESDNNNGQIDNIIFEYKCTNCSTYPIICLLYYCPIENEELAKKNQMRNQNDYNAFNPIHRNYNQNNYNNLNNPYNINNYNQNNQYNKFHPNIFNNPHSDNYYNQQQDQSFFPIPFPHLFPNNFTKIKKKKGFYS